MVEQGGRGGSGCNPSYYFVISCKDGWPPTWISLKCSDACIQLVWQYCSFNWYCFSLLRIHKSPKHSTILAEKWLESSHVTYDLWPKFPKGVREINEQVLKEEVITWKSVFNSKIRENLKYWMITILATAQGMIMARKFDFSQEKMW